MEQIKLTLEAARVNAGYTQQEAADLFGVNVATIGKWERGEIELKYIQLCGMAYVYKVPVECIILPTEITKR